MNDITDRGALPPELDPPAALRERVLARTEERHHVRVLPIAVAAATVAVLGGGAVVAQQLGHDGRGGGTGTTTAPLAVANASPAATGTQSPQEALRCLAITSLSEPKATPRYLVLGSGASNREVQLRELRKSCRPTALKQPKCNGTLALLGLGSPQRAVPVEDLVRRLHFRCLQAK